LLRINITSDPLIHNTILALPQGSFYSIYMDILQSTGKEMDTIFKILESLYGVRASEALELLQKTMEQHAPQLKLRQKQFSGSGKKVRFTEGDALLITYGDMVAPPENTGKPGLDPAWFKKTGQDNPAKRLADFLSRRLGNLFTYIHILPFFPYSSDDGFSVIDYRCVDPLIGTWTDIAAIGQGRRLAFDLVINHASAKSSWFQAFKAGKAPYKRYFITRPLEYDFSTVLRPRTHPLITPVVLDDGQTVGVWTTFSADQVDLDFSQPELMVEFVDIMLGYAERGAGLIRLDAIAYLWKTDGTSCAHLPQTHAVVKLLRKVIDTLGIDLTILTETNVPHNENMSYFGNGDEAHMVYNFSLPPLVLYAFLTGEAEPLSRWAADLKVPPGGTLLNFLASHDGIGVTPARNLISDFVPLIHGVEERGGLVSWKATPGGPVPYELNISWSDAVAPVGADDGTRARALIASYAVACAMDGVPALYFHSMFGSRSWQAGPEKLGYNRAVNRERPALNHLEEELDNPSSMRAMAFAGLSSLLRERAKRTVFSPEAPRKALPAAGPVFAVERGSGAETVLVLVNCSEHEARIVLPPGWQSGTRGFNPVSGMASMPLRSGEGSLVMTGYQVLWIEHSSLE